MTKQNPDTLLNEVRNTLCNLLDSTDDKYMRMQLTLSLKLIDTVIAANKATKTVRARIQNTCRKTKEK